MDLQDVYQQVAPLVFKVALRDAVSGDGAGCGTAFHIGDGYLVTAYHVVEGLKAGKLELESLSNGYYDSVGHSPLIIEEILTPSVVLKRFEEKDPVLYASFYYSDVALLKTNLDARAYIAAWHGKDSVNRVESSILLGIASERIGVASVGRPVVCIGYPRIHGTMDCTSAYCYCSHLAAVGRSYHDKLSRFIIHGTPLGGLSGGPVLIPADDYGHRAVGLIIENSFERTKEKQDDEDENPPADYGYLTAISLTVVEWMRIELKVAFPIGDDAEDRVTKAFATGLKMEEDSQKPWLQGDWRHSTDDSGNPEVF